MRESMPLAAGWLGIAVATYTYTTLLHVSNAATVSTTFLLIVLVVAATSTFRVAVVPCRWRRCWPSTIFSCRPSGRSRSRIRRTGLALIAFLAVSLVASNLSAVARARTVEAGRGATSWRGSST